MLQSLLPDIHTQALITGGTFGVYLEDLHDGETLRINADQVFPSASVIKVPLMIHMMSAADRGELDLDAPLDLDLSHPDYASGKGGSGVLPHLSSRLTLNFRDLITLSIIVSDNIATNLLAERVGMDAINTTLEALGLTETRYTRPIRDWPTLRQPTSNPTTPAEIADLLKRIFRGELPHSDEMLRILKAQQFGSRLPYFLPGDDDDTEVAHKSGSLKGIAHDVGLILNPRFHYVLAVMSSQQANGTAAGLTIARISRLIYDAMIQKYPVQPVS